MIYPNWLVSQGPSLVGGPTKISAFCSTRERPSENDVTGKRATNFTASSSIPSATTALSTTHHVVPTYQHFNLALHVGDDAHIVNANRAYLAKTQQLPSIHWLNQVHGTRCVRVTQASLASAVQTNTWRDADAQWTTETNIALAIMTADCLPVLMTDKQGTVIAAVHAGWRGLFAGILAQQLDTLRQHTGVQAADIVCWFGPCIQQAHFQVGDEVRTQCLQTAQDKQQRQAFEQAFVADNPHTTQKWHADLPAIARRQLIDLGVPEAHISDCGLCTYADAQRFYSYRRDGKHSGRMASVIMKRTESAS